MRLERALCRERCGSDPKIAVRSFQVDDVKLGEMCVSFCWAHFHHVTLITSVLRKCPVPRRSLQQTLEATLAATHCHCEIDSDNRYLSLL